MNDHQKAAAKAGTRDDQSKSPARMHYTHFPEDPGVCPTCGGQFQPRRPWQRFCSKQCRMIGHKQGIAGALHQRVWDLERRVKRLESLLRVRPARRVTAKPFPRIPDAAIPDVSAG